MERFEVIILAIKTDQPESQFALFEDQTLLESINYEAHRDLGRTIHQKIAELLSAHKLNWSDIEGVICFSGPGSFTGLRIGLTVANSLAYGLAIPIIGERGKDWQEKAIKKILNKENDKIVLPYYGAEPHITEARK